MEKYEKRLSFSHQTPLHQALYTWMHACKRLFTSKKKKPYFRIAVIAPADHDLAANIMQGFLSELYKRSSSRFCIDYFHGNGDPLLIQKNARYVADAQYDLILALGASCTQAAKDATDHAQKITPIVFCGFRDPLALKIVPSLPFSGNHLTGVTVGGLSQYLEQIPLMLSIKKSIKNLLIIYNHQSFELTRDAEEIALLLKKNNIPYVTLDTFDKKDLAGAVAHLASTIDTVLVLRDNTSLSCIKQLVEVCNANKITLFASDWYSVSQGAACGFGAAEEITGLAAAEKALLILEKNIPPAEICITSPNYTYRMKINPATMEHQDLPLNNKLKTLINDFRMTTK